MEIPNPDKYKNYAPSEIVGKEGRSEEDLPKRIKEAQENALPLEEAEELDRKEASLMNDFINKRITLSQYNERGRLRLGLNEIEIANEEIMLNVLTTFLGDSLARELLEHELDHFHKAVELGFGDSKLILRFFKENHEISLRPAIFLKLHETGDEDEIRQKLTEIIGAPEELSDLDQHQINK